MIFPLGKARELPIAPALWQQQVAQMPFLRGFDEAQSERLRTLIARFLSDKTITGAHGLVVDDAMRVTIAAQACLPAMRHGLEPYADFVEIVVYPSAFAVQRQVTDDDGVVHEFEDELSGEAMDKGPVVLSWLDVAQTDGDFPANVVIHEFAHKLDMADGEADGCPPMPARLRTRWQRALERAYDQFAADLESIEDDIPAHVDPESDEADAYYARLPIDPYAATDPAEFFAVAAEAFFVEPEPLAAAFPELYGCFVEYFGEDPRSRLAV